MVVPLLTSRSSTGDEIYPKKCQSTATDELSKLVSRGRFEIAVQNSTPNDDGKCKEDKLSRDYLSRIKSLKSSVDISNLEKCCNDKNEYKKIGNRKRESTPESIGKEGCNTLG